MGRGGTPLLVGTSGLTSVCARERCGRRGGPCSSVTEEPLGAEISGRGLLVGIGGGIPVESGDGRVGLRTGKAGGAEGVGVG
jgi:hypothetical protein